MLTAPALASESHFVPLEEYLRTSYRPDCDYVDGRVEERNVGEYEHASVQKALMRLFLANEAAWGVNVIQECRLQVAERRFRVPDTMVLRAEQAVHRIVRVAPLLCIEVISPEDTWKRLREVLDDYLAMGVEHVWCFDPEAREARRYTADGFALVREAELGVAGTEIWVNLDEVFGVLGA